MTITDTVDRQPVYISKIFAVLEAFGGRRTPFGVSQLALRAGVPKSTTHRLLGTLVDSGFVTRVGTQYRLTGALSELAAPEVDRRSDALRAVAVPYMTHLYETTRATVHLGVLDGADVRYVEKIYGHNALPVPSKVGGRLPALCTGLGKAMLAHSPWPMATAALSQPIPRLTPYTEIARSIVERSLRQAKAHGIAVDNEGVAVGARCFAVPVLRPRGSEVLGALSITFPRQARISPETVEQLRKSAAAVGSAC